MGKRLALKPLTNCSQVTPLICRPNTSSVTRLGSWAKRMMPIFDPRTCLL